MKPCLAIMDWGIGGISICKLVKSQIGTLPVIYFSDTGVTPYGKMSHDELASRVDRVISFLREHGVTHLIIGCNAASTVIPFLRTTDIKVEGVIDCAVRFTASMQPKRLALLAGKRTVLSGIYRRAFGELGIDVTQRIAQPLSALIEVGDVKSNELQKECRKIIKPVKDCSHLLLACTHYPAIMPVLKEFVSENTVIVNPVAEIVKMIKRWRLSGAGKGRFFTTGDSDSMKRAAWNAFGYRIQSVTQVEL